MTRRRLLAGGMLLVALGIALPAWAQPRSGGGLQRPALRLPPVVKALRDLEYARAGDTPLLLDLFTPEKADKTLPLIVWIHGGAWRAGSKENCPALPMTAQGYAVASINYRLSQEAIFPAQIHDCKAAIRFLRAGASKYNIDPDRIGVWGGSAGGHLVALLGTSGDVKDLEGDEGNLEHSSRVQAVCDWFGPTDLLQMPEGPLPPRPGKNDASGPVALLLGGRIAENKDKAAKASPVTYVTRDDPPFLIMHGDKDNLVPLQQSRLFYDALQKAGVDARLEIIKGAGHGFGGLEIFKTVSDFFNKNLKKSPAGTPPSTTKAPAAPATQKAQP